MATLKIDDGEPAKAEGDVAGQITAFVIRAAMVHRIHHPLDQCRGDDRASVKFEFAADATHCLSKDRSRGHLQMVCMPQRRRSCWLRMYAKYDRSRKRGGRVTWAFKNPYKMAREPITHGFCASRCTQLAATKRG